MLWLVVMRTTLAAPWLGLAFLRAKPGVPRDHFMSTMTWGPFVHTEVLLARDEGDVRAYASFDGVSGFTPSRHSPYSYRTDEWVVLRFRLSPGGYERAYALVLQLVALGLPYNSRDLWLCCVKVALPFKPDLDCERPETWRDGGVFCSQAALLVLRRLARTGVLRPLPSSQRALVESTNSRGCSPNALFALLTQSHAP